MRIYGVDHIQVAIPPGAEQQARSFYAGVLGLYEIPRPADLASKGGMWFQVGAVQLHLGVETEFRPARKAHPALLVEGLDDLITLLEAKGYPTRVAETLSGTRRVHVHDPFGNRIELMQRP
ncbi:MAG TPA: VOC family protein [Blastocatellia bacterium]|nr:VOC family protein [Blastocatellia bacterium]